MARAERRRPAADAARQASIKATNGWIGHTHSGRRRPTCCCTPSAQRPVRRATTSLSYARDGDDYLVVASKGGDPKAPGWYHNLKANPNVEINVGPKRFSVTATPVCAGRPRLCAAVADRQRQRGNKDRYNGYQKRTTRPIPVVRLTPAVQPTELEQLLGEQFQRRVARGRGRGIGTAARRRDRVDHHLVDAELVGQRAHLIGGLGRGADDGAPQPATRPPRCACGLSSCCSASSTRSSAPSG